MAALLVGLLEVTVAAYLVASLYCGQLSWPRHRCGYSQLQPIYVNFGPPYCTSGAARSRRGCHAG